MKRTLLTTSVLVPFGLAIGVGCAVDDGPINNNMTMGTGMAGEMGTGGDQGQGGNGQAGVGQAGNGVAGNMAGSGGMGQAGNMAGAAGMGMAGSMAGAAGMGGMGMAGTNLIDQVAGQKSMLGFAWKDSWMLTGCQQKAQHDCITMPTCPPAGALAFEDRGAVIKETFKLGGEMGKMYTVSFKFNSVAEGKYYSGGTPAATLNAGTINSAILDTFHTGGTAVQGSYNVMRIRVLDPAGMEVGKYYMNSFPQGTGAESHKTFLLGYAHTMDVPGMGSVEYQVADSNCHAIDNCNAGDVVGDTCNAARPIPNEANATLPAMYPDPKAPTTPIPIEQMNSRTGNKQPWHSQVGHFTITSIVAK